LSKNQKTNHSLYLPYYPEERNEFRCPSSCHSIKEPTCIDVKQWQTICNAV